MSTTTPPRSRPEHPVAPRPGSVAGDVGSAARGRLAPLRQAWVGVRDALDRPLTSYYLLLGASALLLVIGLVMVLSASSVWSYERFDGDSYALAKRQLLWVLLGLPAAVLAARMPERWVRRLAWWGLLIALGLLVATQMVGAEEVNGNKNWLVMGPITIQPAEIAKLALVIWAAHVYAVKESLLDDWRHCFVPVVPGVLLAAGLVLWGRDLGTALVFFVILAGMLWVAGAPLRMFVIALLVMSVGVLGLAATSSERQARLLNFLDPFSDLDGQGWQAAHGLYALSSGGWFGQGIGASQEKWGALYGAQTDYIFAVIGEELGLIGTMLVLGLFLTIAFAAIRVALSTSSAFVRYATFGAVIWLLGQMMINVGMVLAVLPVIGIPLPLVSYGGSALVPSLVALGLLVGFARREPEAAAALAARREQRRPAGAAGAGRRLVGARVGAAARAVHRFGGRRVSLPRPLARPLARPVPRPKAAATRTRTSAEVGGRSGSGPTPR